MGEKVECCCTLGVTLNALMEHVAHKSGNISKLQFLVRRSSKLHQFTWIMSARICDRFNRVEW